jgi:hypothetical protein
MLGMLAGSKVAGGVGWSDPALRRGIAKWFDMIESYITHDIHNAFKRHRAIKSALVKFGPCSARCSASREADGCPTTKLFANDNDKPFAPLLRATFLFTICLSRFLFKRATPITGTWNRTEAGMHDSACTRSYVVVVVVAVVVVECRGDMAAFASAMIVHLQGTRLITAPFSRWHFR